jgi:hypothetical protein
MSRYETIRQANSPPPSHSVYAIGQAKLIAFMRFGGTVYAETTVTHPGMTVIETWWCGDTSTGIFQLIDRVCYGPSYRPDMKYGHDLTYPLYCRVRANARK